MNDSEPSAFEHGKILGEIDQHLENIDQSLVDGKETMKGLQDSITDGFKEQNEQIHAIDKELGEHKQKGHYCHLANSEAKRNGRWREHAPAVAKGGGVSALIGGIAFVILKAVGLI